MNKKGVTLIELIVVMVIIAIGATLMVPPIGRWLPNYRLRSATRDIVSTMRTAQMRAVSTNMNYRVSFNNPVAGSYILQRNTGGVGLYVSEGAAQTLPSGITIDATTFLLDGTGKPYVQFNTDSTSSTGGITLKNNKETKKSISVTTSTGRVNVQ